MTKVSSHTVKNIKMRKYTQNEHINYKDRAYIIKNQTYVILHKIILFISIQVGSATRVSY